MMKDSTKAYAIMLGGYVPVILLISILACLGLVDLVYIMDTVETTVLVLTILFCIFMFTCALQSLPRVQHFTAARDKWERSYVYEDRRSILDTASLIDPKFKEAFEE